LKAAVFYGPGDVRIEERSKPSVDPDSISIRVKWTSLCGTDSHIYQGNFAVNSPLILGHDFSGVVDEVGSNVTRLTAGDRVVAEPIRYCGTCSTCLKGRYTVCENRKIMGMHADGSLAEFVVAPQKNVFRIPLNVSFEEAAIMEPVAVALHSMDYAKPVPGENAVILGQGPIGLLHTQIAKISGLKVLAVEVNSKRLRLASKFDADYVIDPSKEDLKTRVMKLTRGGADIVIDTTGSAKTVEIGPHIATNAGRIVLVGSSQELMTHGPASEMVLSKELSVYGVAGAPMKYPVALELVADRKVDVKSLITHKFKLSQAEKALRLLHDEKGLIKALVSSRA
jgi:2-desacetyl-2-hydroxyethyl bacteriochlorophyllide A dehydrogenase